MSVISRRVFLSSNSKNQGLMCLAQGHNAVTPVRFEPTGKRSGSVVECLTRDRRAAGLSLTGVAALWSLSKSHLSQLSTGSTQEDPSLYN